MIDPRLWSLIVPPVAAAAIMVVTPPRWRWRAAMLWLVLPALGYVAVIGWELATRPPQENAFVNAVFGFLLIGSLMAIPWLALSFAGFGLGLLARRVLGIGKPGVAAVVEPEMSPLTLAEVEAEVARLAAKIEAPGSALPTFGKSHDNGRPHVEVDDRYHWVVAERGQEIERRTSAKLDDLLYWLFEGVTWDVANEFAARHRDPSEDFRRKLFARQAELMGTLDPRWAVRLQGEIDRTLAEHPFVDT